MKMKNPEAVAKALVRLQNQVRVVNTEVRFTLFTEEADWIVVLQVLKERGLVEYAQRPPYQALVDFSEAHGVTRIPYEKSYVGRLSNKLGHARYPWADVQIAELQSILPRWRNLHERLNVLLDEEMHSSHDR